MFYDILITAFAITIALYGWYVIGLVLSRLGATNLINKLSIPYERRISREIVFTIMGLTVVPICALYLIVVSACVNLDND